MVAARTNRFSIFALARNALSGHAGWARQWRSPKPKPAYDAVIVGGGGHGLATAYYLAKEHRRMIGNSKRDFVGKRSLLRPDLVAPGRKQPVGLLTDDPTLVIEEGAQLVEDPRQPVPMTMLGDVTSSYFSVSCGRSIALALLAGGRGRLGEILHATTPGGFAAVKVVPPVFFDPQGRRVHG